MRYRTLLAALGALACAAPTTAQKAPVPAPTPAPAADSGDTTRAMPASLLRRLAEAVDGYRSGDALFVVAAWHFPHDVAGVFGNARQATEIARRKGVDYGVFGPYFAPPDSGNELMFYSLRPCPGLHEPDSWCPDTTFALNQAVALANIQDITITIHAKSGPAVERVLAPGEVDAVFFTLSAIDKFVMPYYTRVYSAQFAADMRAAYLRNLRALRK
jgi:hypothetical protein